MNSSDARYATATGSCTQICAHSQWDACLCADVLGRTSRNVGTVIIPFARIARSATSVVEGVAITGGAGCAGRNTAPAWPQRIGWRNWNQTLQRHERRGAQRPGDRLRTPSHGMAVHPARKHLHAVNTTRQRVEEGNAHRGPVRYLARPPGSRCT
jgi:hypothetical protein